MPQDTFGREDWSHRVRGIRAPPELLPAEEFFSSLRERFVAANMIGVGPGIDDVANGLRRDPLDRGQYGRRVWRPSRRPRRRRRPRLPARRCSRRRRRSRKTMGRTSRTSRPFDGAAAACDAAAFRGARPPPCLRESAAQTATRAVTRARRHQCCNVIVIAVGTAEANT